MTPCHSATCSALSSSILGSWSALVPNAKGMRARSLPQRAHVLRQRLQRHVARWRQSIPLIQPATRCSCEVPGEIRKHKGLVMKPSVGWLRISHCFHTGGVVPKPNPAVQGLFGNLLRRAVVKMSEAQLSQHVDRIMEGPAILLVIGTVPTGTRTPA